MKRLLVSLTICAAVLGMAVSATAQDRTWSGAGVDKNWSTVANWSGTFTNPYPNRAIFDNTDISGTVPKVVDVSWSVGGIRAVNTTGKHLINLNGNTLSIITNSLATSGDLYVKPASGSACYFAISNGTLSIGRDLFVSLATQSLSGVTVSGPIRIAQIGEHGVGGNAHLDMRGASAAGGTLAFGTLYVGQRNQNGYLYLDNTTVFNTLKVTNLFSIGLNQGCTGRIGWQDPARANEWYLPIGMNITLGNPAAGAAGRGKFWVGTTPGDYASSDGRMIADTNGLFDAWLSEFKVGTRDSTFENNTTGYLDLRRMDALTADVTEMRIGTCTAANSGYTANGYVYLPAGTARVDRLYVGDDVRATAVALLDLSGTTLEVDERFDLRDISTTTAELFIRVRGKSCGLDLAANVATTITGPSKIRLLFERAPDAGESPYWGIRHAGNKAAVLGGLLNAGTIIVTNTFSGASSYKAAVWYDSGADATYVGLVDAGASVPAVVAAKDIAVEVGGDATTRIGPTDILLAAYHPTNSAVTGRKISHPDYAGGAESDYIDFATSGPLPLTNLNVTLSVTFADASTATDTCDVVFTPIAAATTAAVTWSGGALWQYLDRREWRWGGNWLGFQPPTNPSTATVTFSDLDTSATKIKLLAPVPDVGGQPTNVWTVGSLRASNTASQHILDLGGKTLRTTGEVRSERGVATGIADMTVSNGTLVIGTDLVLNNGKFRLAYDTVTLPTNRTVQVINSGILALTNGTTISGTLKEVLVASLTGGSGGGGTAYLDARGGAFADGLLDVSDLRIGGGGAGSTGYFYVGPGTLNTIRARNNLFLNSSYPNGGQQRGGAFIGAPDPARGSAWYLPYGVSIYVGSPTVRGRLHIHRNESIYAGGQSRLAVAGGGTFEAWLHELIVAITQGTQDGAVTGTLDLRGMDSFFLSANTVQIGLDTGTRGSLGQVNFPAGTAILGTVTMGRVTNPAPQTASYARLDLSNTVCTVTNTLTLNATAQVTIKVTGERSSGLELPGLPTVASGATLAITFQAKPTHSKIHYGLKVAGDVQSALSSAPWLSWNDDALGARQASVFVYQGNTYVGVPAASGTILLVR